MLHYVLQKLNFINRSGENLEMHFFGPISLQL